MRTVTPAERDLARIIWEQAGNQPASPQGQNLMTATFEKLRLHLLKLIGVMGFQTMFARALALAKLEIDWLHDVQIDQDGSLIGFVEAAFKSETNDAAEGGIALLAHLLSLLDNSIGEILTFRLVKSIWPEISDESILFNAGEGP